MPTSACLRAGASFTPSPVMPTTWPACCSARTRLNLSSGQYAGVDVAVERRCGVRLAQRSGRAGARADPDLRRDRARGLQSVAGDHDHAHAERAQAGDQLRRVGARRVAQGEQPGELERAFGPGGDRDHPLAAGGEPLESPRASQAPRRRARATASGAPFTTRRRAPPSRDQRLRALGRGIEGHEAQALRGRRPAAPCARAAARTARSIGSCVASSLASAARRSSSSSVCGALGSSAASVRRFSVMVPVLSVRARPSPRPPRSPTGA